MVLVVVAAINGRIFCFYFYFYFAQRKTEELCGGTPKKGTLSRKETCRRFIGIVRESTYESVTCR